MTCLVFFPLQHSLTCGQWRAWYSFHCSTAWPVANAPVQFGWLEFTCMGDIAFFNKHVKSTGVPWLSGGSLYVLSTILIDKVQPSTLSIYVPSCGISGQSLIHTGGCILDTQWNTLQWWFWPSLLHTLPVDSFVCRFHKLLFPCK